MRIRPRRSLPGNVLLQFQEHFWSRVPDEKGLNAFEGGALDVDGPVGLADVTVKYLCPELVPESLVCLPQFLDGSPETKEILLLFFLEIGI